MPLYEYFCRACGSKFELLRPMSSSDAAATCPKGHAGAMRTLSLFATVGRDAGGDVMEMPAGGGGCGCGGACACGGH
jgi:putative FmdB family regulatory protein